MQEPGRVADDVGEVVRAVGGDDPVGDDPLDPGAYQLDVGQLQAAHPGAVVLEDALAHGRVVRHDLLEQLGMLGHEGLHRRQQCRRALGVERVDRLARRVLPVGIDAVGIGARRDAGEGHDEAEPAPVEGEVAERPLVARRHGRVVQRVRDDPLGGALEDRELCDIGRDGGRDLEAAGAGTDEGERGSR